MSAALTCIFAAAGALEMSRTPSRALVDGLARASRRLAASRRDTLGAQAAAALSAAAVALPAFAVDQDAAIAVERAGFSPRIQTKGKFSRYEDTILGAKGSKRTVDIAFEYPSSWTAFKNSVDVIDGNSGTTATVVAVPLRGRSLDSKAVYAGVFSADGKIQRAGTPIDEFKVLRVSDGVLPDYKEIALKYTAVSPNQRLVDRRAVATATAVGDTAYIFVVSAAAVKWKDEEVRCSTAARTFTAQ